MKNRNPTDARGVARIALATEAVTGHARRMRGRAPNVVASSSSTYSSASLKAICGRRPPGARYRS